MTNAPLSQADLSQADIALYRIDFMAFTKRAFQETHGFQFQENYHHAQIAYELERVFLGDINRLIITMPPRAGKTELATVCFTAWCMGNFPDSEFILASYSKHLASINNYNVRALMRTDFYRSIYPHVALMDDSQAKDYFKTTHGGASYAVGTGGTIAGFGAGKLRNGFGGAIIIDDPLNTDDTFSKVERENNIQWFRTVLESRKNSPDTPIIVIMQRLHKEDLAGWLLDGGNGEQWQHLSIKAYDEFNDSSFWEDRFPVDSLKRLKSQSSYVFQSQYQQEPQKLGGNVIKSTWFQRYVTLPRIKRRIITVDTAYTTKNASDYTVFMLSGVGEDGNLYILDIQRGQWETPQVIRQAKDFWNKHAADRRAESGFLVGMMFESVAVGTAIIQQLKADPSAHFPILSVTPDKDKFSRVMGVSGYLEAGKVFIPEKAPWVSEFISEFEAFTPNDSHEHDDQIDATVYAIQELLVKQQAFTSYAAAMA